MSVNDIHAAKRRREPWTMLTSYDALTASIFEEAGARALLVGDTAAMTVLGYETTLTITLDEMITFASAVTRSTRHAMIIGDMPFGSYQSSVEVSVQSATRYFKEAGVGAVKLEGGHTVAPQVEAIAAAGMPVVAHVGLTPQSVHALGGMQRVQGRGEAGERLLEDAKTLESSGAFAIVLEAVPATLAKKVTSALSIPTIGIGAGVECDAQVMVWQDMVGLTTGRSPKFVKRYADVHDVISTAAASFVADVRERRYPAAEHSYD